MKSWSLRNNSTVPTVIAAHDEKIRDMHRRVMADEKVYVKFTKSHDERRTGSIGYLSNFDIKERAVYSGYSRSFFSGRTAPPDSIRPQVVHMEVMWEGRKNVIRVWDYDIEILDGYTGGSVWKWEKPQGPLVEAKDRTGREIKKGDFINYVLHHHVSYGTTIHFGTVSKVDRDGTVWAKNVKVDDKETVAEKRIKNNENIVVLTKDLLDRLMLLKLASA
jgi:hypothetical protein